MNDRFIMENLLLTTKGVCDLYMHGAIESATCNVHDTFDKALNKSLCMQSGLYQKMASKGDVYKRQPVVYIVTAI